MQPNIAIVGATGAVGEVMRHDLKRVTIPPETDALVALSKMQRTASSRLLVADKNHLVGIISLKDLLRFLQLKIELDGADGNDDPCAIETATTTTAVTAALSRSAPRRFGFLRSASRRL